MSENRKCRKCGSFSITIEWDMDSDMLECVCDECGYPWKERALDSYEVPCLKND